MRSVKLFLVLVGLFFSLGQVQASEYEECYKGLAKFSFVLDNPKPGAKDFEAHEPSTLERVLADLDGFTRNINSKLRTISPTEGQPDIYEKESVVVNTCLDVLAKSKLPSTALARTAAQVRTRLITLQDKLDNMNTPTTTTPYPTTSPSKSRSKSVTRP